MSDIITGRYEVLKLNIARLNSGNQSFFWEWYFWFQRGFWGYLTIANSMVLKFRTNFMGVWRYSLGKFNNFSLFCVGLTKICGRNALESHLLTDIDIINKQELLFWCFPYIRSKSRSEIPVFRVFFHLWTRPTQLAVPSRPSGLA